MRQAQRGGTILGIIIGVVIGLGLALAVAIYVTKVPVPFMNKNQPRKAEQDAAEALKNKNWDPNAPLYGKNPARPAASAASDAAPAVPAAVGVSAAKPARPADTAATPAPTPKPEARAASSADPLGDLAKSRSAAAPAAAATADPFSYFVQAGAFRTPEDAEAQRAKLGLMGLEAKVTEREQSGRTVFRVRVGPFDNKDAADKTKERLEGAAIESTLVRVQR
jgi:cell division protein FtsN